MNMIDSAKALGLTSLAIGLTEVAAPRKVEKWLGIGNGTTTSVLRTLGIRELLHGVDVLGHHHPASSLWRRVVGDVVDTALLGVAAMKTRRPVAFAIISGMVLAIGAADLLCASKLSKEEKVFN
jgi:hypothetical protein